MSVRHYAATNRVHAEIRSWGGRFFCSIEMHEGEDLFNIVSQFLGDDVLMHASDYPHPECRFPGSVDHVLGWENVTPETQQKLFWGNAARFYKQT